MSMRNTHICATHIYRKVYKILKVFLKYSEIVFLFFALMPWMNLMSISPGVNIIFYVLESI